MKRTSVFILLLLLPAVVAAQGLDFGSGEIYGTFHNNHTVEDCTWPEGSDDQYLWMGGLWTAFTINDEEIAVAVQYADYGWAAQSEMVTSDEPEWSDIPDGVSQLSDLDFFYEADDSAHPDPPGLHSWCQGMSWADAPDNDYLILHYTVFNNTGEDIDDFYLGFLADADVGPEGNDSMDDWVAYDSSGRFGYMYDDDDSSLGYIGVKPLINTACSFNWWDWNNNPESDTEIYYLMANGEFDDPPTEAFDYRFLICCGPYQVDDGDELCFDVALAVGEDLDDLRANMNAAVTIHDDLPIGVRLLDFTAESRGADVGLSWLTDGDAVGYRLSRRPAGSVAWTLLTEEPLSGGPAGSYLDRALEPGEYDYRLTALEPDGRSVELGTCAVSVTGQTPGGLSLDGIYPSPAAGRTTCLVEVPEAGTVTLTLYDLAGRRVLERSVEVTAGRREIGLDVAGLETGVYTLRVDGCGERASGRLVISR